MEKKISRRGSCGIFLMGCKLLEDPAYSVYPIHPAIALER